MSAPLIYSLEGRYYTDPDIFAQEMQGLLSRTWQLAGHISQIPNAGDYFAFEIAGESCFVFAVGMMRLECFTTSASTGRMNWLKGQEIRGWLCALIMPGLMS